MNLDPRYQFVFISHISILLIYMAKCKGMLIENFPSGFIDKYQELLSAEDFAKLLEFSGKSLRKSLRVNTLKISVADFKKLAEKKAWELSPIPWCDEGFWIDREDKSLPLGKTIEHTMGLFFIQESSSMMPAFVLGKGDRILDMCAAPGAKTSQLSAMTQNHGLIVANDMSASRLKKLAFNTLRSGNANVIISHKNGEKFAYETPEYFDKILLDAPCTGEGTVRKDRDALKNWSLSKIKMMSGIQKKLILSAFQALKEGGEMVYSTCTLAPEENEEVVAHLLENEPSAELLDLSGVFAGAEKAPALDGKSLRIAPYIFDSEGFFVAKIRKNSTKRHEKPRFKSKLQKIHNKDFARIQAYFEENFNYDLEDLYKQFYIKDNKIFVLPEGFSPTFAFDRAGFLLCELHEKNIRLSHEGAIMLGSKFRGERVIALADEEIGEFFVGRDLEVKTALKSGQVILTYGGRAIGTAKIIGNKLKNLLPRNFVQDVVI